MKRWQIVIPILLILLPFAKVSGTTYFSKEIEVGELYTWEVTTFIIDGSEIDESSEDNFLHQGSIIEVEVLDDITKINLSESLDISLFFSMTYDDSKVRDLTTIPELTLAGQLVNPYPTFWDSFIFFVFPIISLDGNRFDAALANPAIGLTWVDFSATSDANLEGDVFVFEQSTTKYKFRVEYDYSRGILIEGSLITDSNEVLIQKIKAKNNESLISVFTVSSSITLAAMVVIKSWKFRQRIF